MNDEILDDAELVPRPPIYFKSCVRYAKMVGACLLFFLAYAGARLLNIFDVLSAFGFLALLLICLLLIVFAVPGFAAGIRSYYHKEKVSKMLWLYVFLHLSVIMSVVGIVMTTVYVIFNGIN